MRVSVLASGSRGNATFVEVDNTRILVDAGISATRIKKSLAELEVPVESLDGILITHEHTDHVKGLLQLGKKYHLPMFSRRETFLAMPDIKDIPSECINFIDGFGAEAPTSDDPSISFHANDMGYSSFSLGKVKIESFSISHDAANPCGYRICGTRKCVVATDLGFITASVQEALEGADALVLEANHDLDMLQQGRYSWPLKRRIMSNRGHLANNDAAWALVRMKQKPRQVLLAHLSQENNRPEVALSTVRNILAQQGMASAMELNMTYPDKAVHITV